MFPFFGFIMVRITGIEPARLMAIEPKSIVSAYFTISAYDNPEPEQVCGTYVRFVLAVLNDRLRRFLKEPLRLS